MKIRVSGEQATKAIWCRRLRNEMRVWRYGEVLMKGKKGILV
jgi:hypothetical protein